MPVVRDHVRRIISLLEAAFDWKDSPDGFEFWNDVSNKLGALISDAEQPEPSPQYREPNEGDVGRMVEIRADNTEKWYEGKLAAIDDGWFACVVKFTEFSAMVACRHARIAVEPEPQPDPPEPEWITPTDEDALRRPEVEVFAVSHESWIAKKLLAVLPERGCSFVVSDVGGNNVNVYRECRMRKDATWATTC